jgi:type IV pilus assembly protein PilQ
MELAALENEGHAKIISNPRLLTVNSKPAYIEAGAEIPYQEKTSSGATNIAFKKAVLSLKVTPEIIAKKISLLIELNQDKVSELVVGGVPAIDTRAIKTQAILNNGETIVLGGIYEYATNKAWVRVPFLGSIPGIGALFSHQQTKLERRELLIFVTPEIVG